MHNISKIYERYSDWYCEELFKAYFNKLMSLDEILAKLDYDQILSQKELYNFLNLLLTENFPHVCYNEICQKKLYFSNTFDTAKKFLDLSLKTFIRIWITPHNLGKFSTWNIKIPFFCCKCYEERLKYKKYK